MGILVRSEEAQVDPRDATLAMVKESLVQLRTTAELVFAQYQTKAADAWGLDDYLACIDVLEHALDRAMEFPEGTMERFVAEKLARNRIAQRLYYRGRLCLRTQSLGRFYKKSGEKGVHWAPTELSRAADRLAAEPLRQIYKRTEACITS